MKKKSLLAACILGAALTIGCHASAVYAAPVSQDNVVVVKDGDDSVFKVNKMRKDNMLDEYRLFKYDKIQLIAIGFEEFAAATSTSTRNDIMIGVDGIAQIPYVGNVKLAGLTLEEARTLLEDKLGRYFKLSGFNVFLTEYGKRKVYVMGNVRSQGIKEMPVDNMNVYAAISAAGGVDKRGRSKHVQVLRQIDDKLYFREVNLDGFVKNHDMSQNIVIEDGDIVYVPDSGKVIWSEDIAPYINIYSVYRSIVK
ncbi:Polysaccharide export protein [Anaerovibrio sp. JC8]|uniref:polysaccharide biosynthesis/export family protein n=1 Tax=Anaerovibrio sp. JC8 TaxID=1240085 RepID=UPI000A09F6F9|nr:polysaccharide biosynthesis/export family protein [Anaerovibrio sp. JC8]ORU01451.1 Polysaccharide export protein [Anaerovibrio sp. JC8]